MVRPSSQSANASFATPKSSPSSSDRKGRIVTLRYGTSTGMLTGTKEVPNMGFAISSLDGLGEGYGFRKVRSALGVTAFGVNAVVMAPGFEGFLHYHDTQDELYFVHQGTARFEIGDEVRVLGPGSLVHVESSTPRRFS